MADNEAVITFGTDLSQVERDLRDFTSRVERTPVRIGGSNDRFRQTMLDAQASFGALPSTSMIGGASAGALAAAAGGFAASGGSGVAGAGAEVAAALRSAAAQIRGAGMTTSFSGGVPMLPGPGMAHVSAGMGTTPGGQSLLPLSLARQQGMLPSPAIMSSGGSAAGYAGSNAPIAVQVRRTMAAGGGGGMPPNFINIPSAGGGGGGFNFNNPANAINLGGGGGGGGGSVPSGSGGSGGRPGGGNPLTPSISAIRGLFYSMGINEANNALRSERIGMANARYGSGMEAGLDAELSIISGATSGVFGSVAGLVSDIPGHLDSKLGRWAGNIAGGILNPSWAGSALGAAIRGSPMPGRDIGTTDAQVLAIEAKAINRASMGNISDRARNMAMGRIVGAGDGRYSQRAAGIENEYRADLRDTAFEREQLPQDPSIRSERRRVLDERDTESATMKAFRTKQMMMDAHDDVASFADRAQVARGYQTTGQAGRNTIIRRQSRSPTNGIDSEVNAAELGAYDASEGYRIWGREYGAGIDAQSARDRFRLQPNVANVRGIYGRGVLAEENARREGSSREADLIRETTQYDLASYGRDLINRGSASYADNPAQIDYGQIGSSGRRTDNPGDDTGKTLQMIYDMVGEKLTEAINKLQSVDEKI